MNRGGLTLAAVAEDWPLARPFVISRSARTQARVVTLSVDDGQGRGYGECQPNSRYGETAEEVVDQLNALDGRFGSVDALRAALPASRAARNALDCALWDLAAKRRGCRVWDLLGLDAPGDIVTAVTVSLGPPDTMARHAAELVAGGARLLKLKLGGDGDMARVRAVRAAAPDVRLIADANESWTPDMLVPNLAAMAACGVELLEQPLPADADEALAGLDRPLPVCADESCLDVNSLSRLVGRYDAVNVKLDKTGGLTQGLALLRAAQKAGLKTMIGCMLGTSLAMAPAHLLAALADWADIDGFLLLSRDRTAVLPHRAGPFVGASPAALWG